MVGLGSNFDGRHSTRTKLEISAHTRLGIDALDRIGLTDANLLTRIYKYSDYIQIRNPVYIPHTAGRYAAKRFRKAQCPIIERLTNSLMMNGRNNGKKLMAVRIVAHAFEIVRAFSARTWNSARQRLPGTNY